MQCRNHSEVPAIERCTGCAEPFCGDCLVEMHGQKYCGVCKTMALKGQPEVIEEATIPCKEANQALTCALIGLLFFSIILEPIALVNAAKAKKLIDADARLQGSGKVVASMVIGIVALALSVLNLIARAAHAGQG